MKNNIRIIEISDLKTALRQITDLNPSISTIKGSSERAVFKAIKILNLDARIANFLKQKVLLTGGDAVISKDVDMFNGTKTDILILANLYQYEILCKILEVSEFSLEDISKKIKEVIFNHDKDYNKIKIGKKEFNFNKKTYVMGILNLTPDSFSDGGKYNNIDLALKRTMGMIDEGVDIIDIGAESAKPGIKALSLEEELDRILPILEKIRKETDIPISIDTYKSKVAEESLKIGANIINDITGLKYDKKMAEIISDYDAYCVLMHMQGEPQTMQNNPVYDNVISDIILELNDSLKIAEIAGIKSDKIILDPGIGFGKNLKHNVSILKELKEFKSLGFPLLIGASRKSFIGKILNIENAQDRLEGSLAVGLISAFNGASILRVHDIKETARILKMFDYIYKNS